MTAMCTQTASKGAVSLLAVVRSKNYLCKLKSQPCYFSPAQTLVPAQVAIPL